MKTCKYCKAELIRPSNYSTKQWDNRKYCTHTCMKNDVKICKVEGCSKIHYGFGYCKNHYRKYKKYGDPLGVAEVFLFNGGVTVDKKGYVSIYSPNHPNRDRRKYVYEHRLVIEKHLGRYLTKEEVVHHKDNNPSNNRIENLQLFKNNGLHISFHNKEKKDVEKICV